MDPAPVRLKGDNQRNYEVNYELFRTMRFLPDLIVVTIRFSDLIVRYELFAIRNYLIMNLIV